MKINLLVVLTHTHRVRERERKKKTIKDLIVDEDFSLFNFF